MKPFQDEIIKLKKKKKDYESMIKEHEEYLKLVDELYQFRNYENEEIKGDD